MNNYHMKNHQEWLDIVAKHYGSLDGFDDARTVRIMLRYLKEHKAHCNEMIATYSNLASSECALETDAIYLSEEYDFLEEINDAIHDMEQWFVKKGIDA